MKKQELIKSFVQRLQKYFLEHDEIVVSLAYYNTLDNNNTEIFIDAVCSFVISGDSCEELCFDPCRNKFFYFGQPVCGYTSAPTFFYLNQGLLSSLPTGLIEALTRVSKTRKSETHEYPSNQLIANRLI